MLISLLVDICTTSIAFGKAHIYAIQGIYTVVEYLLFSTFLYLTLGNPILRKIILFFSVVFVVVTLYNFLRIDKSKFDSFGSSLEGILLIIYCIMYFYEQLTREDDNLAIYTSPNFWVVLAVLLYTSSTLFLFIITSSLSKDDQDRYWPINIFSNILINLFFSVAFVLNKFGSKKPITDERFS